MFYTSSAQQNIAITEKPYMWVAKDVGNSMIAAFNKKKLPIISRNIGVPQKDSFYLGNFFGMISYFIDTYKNDFRYLHVYIGVCEGINPIPIGYIKKLILIFAPSNSLDIDRNLGYYILPSAFDINNPTKFKIDINQETEWTGKYVDYMPLGTISHSAPENQFEDRINHKKYLSETRCITYCTEDIKYLMKVKDYYSKSYQISNNLVGYLGAYSNKGLPNGQDRGKFKNRISTQFEFLDNTNNIFYLDDISGFLDLPSGVSMCPPAATDNGQLCPTYCY